MRKRRIGVLTGGGDCAGLSPAVKSVVNAALDQRRQWRADTSYEVFGIHDGWKGLLCVDPDNLGGPEEWVVPLNNEMVRTWDRYGGTFLGTSRTNPYDPDNDRSATVLKNIERLGLDAIIAIGGEDTLGVAHRLSRDGVNVVGIPKTIDKDLPETDYTLGFETALNVITEEIDRLRTTAGSHKRTFVVETMGRHAGWLALEGGESSGAYIILIPEYDFAIDRVVSLILESRSAGERYNIIVAAEGAKPAGGAEFVRERGTDGFGHKVLGGVGEFVASSISEATGLECRSVVLSHLQRGGAPCAYDRRMGKYFGIAAIDLVVAGEYGKMVSYRNGRISAVPLEAVLGRPSLVNVTTQYDTERYSGRRTILELPSKETAKCTPKPTATAPN